MSPDRVRFAFVLGTGRCGSSLVQEVLARHPSIGFVSNLDDRLSVLDLRGRWNNAIYRRIPPSMTRKGRARFAPSEGYRLLERRVSPSLSVSSGDLTAHEATPQLARNLASFFAARAHAQRKPVFLHKFTGWPRAGFLHAVFPEARFIHVVRDGRAVADSFVRMPWWSGHRGPAEWTYGPLPERYAAEWTASGESRPLLAGVCWKLLIDAFDTARQAVPSDRWLEVRYEDVCADPRAMFGEMLEFMELDWNDRFETGFARHRFEADADGYRTRIDISDLALLDISLGEHLRRYGYDVRAAGARA